MANGSRGQATRHQHGHNHHQAQGALDRELAELEKRKLAELRGERVRITQAGLIWLERRFPRGRR